MLARSTFVIGVILISLMNVISAKMVIIWKMESVNLTVVIRAMRIVKLVWMKIALNVTKIINTILKPLNANFDTLLDVRSPNSFMIILVNIVFLVTLFILIIFVDYVLYWIIMGPV